MASSAAQGYAFTGANALALRAYTAPNLSSWPGSTVLQHPAYVPAGPYPILSSQLGGQMGTPGEPSVPPGWGPFTGGEGAPGGGFGGGAGGAANLLPDPGAIVGEAGSAVVGAAGKALADFWQRSGATIGVLVLGLGAVAIALLRTETVQTALAAAAGPGAAAATYSARELNQLRVAKAIGDAKGRVR